MVSDKRIAYIVIIGGAHLQAACAFGTAAAVSIANNIFEGITSAPLATRPSDVALHGIMFREIIP